jgi:hypothetical protein
MRREQRDELLRSCLAINALLREEINDARKALQASKEEKYNPNWPLQPRAPRGTAEGGQWTDGGTASTVVENVEVEQPAPSAQAPPTIQQVAADDSLFDTNGVPTPGWAEPDWEYPAFPHTSRDGEPVRMSPETELLLEAIIGSINAAEELRYRSEMGRSAEDSYELLLIQRGVQYFRNVPVMTREGLRVYDFLQRGPLGWEFVEVKANRAIATPRQIRIDTAVQIFGFAIEVGLLQGIQGPTNVRLMRAVPSDQPYAPE